MHGFYVPCCMQFFFCSKTRRHARVRGILERYLEGIRRKFGGHLNAFSRKTVEMLEDIKRRLEVSFWPVPRGQNAGHFVFSSVYFFFYVLVFFFYGMPFLY